MNITRKILTLILAIIFLNSCVSTQKYSKYVTMKYAQQCKTLESNDYIEYENIIENEIDSIVKTEKVKSLFVPALVYWKWNNTIKCELSPKQTFMTFQNHFQYYADSLNIKEKLKEQKLIITIDSIPKTFVYTNKGFVVFMLVAYSYGGLEAIFPENNKLVLSYKVVQGTTQTKSGQIEVVNTDIPLKNIWKSTKQFTWFYINQYENNLKRMSKFAIEKLENEL